MITETFAENNHAEIGSSGDITSCRTVPNKNFSGHITSGHISGGQNWKLDQYQLDIFDRIANAPKVLFDIGMPSDISEINPTINHTAPWEDIDIKELKCNYLEDILFP